MIGSTPPSMRLMIVGASLGVGANLCFAFTGNAAGMFGGPGAPHK